MSPYYHITLVEEDGNTMRLNLKSRQVAMLHDVLAKWDNNMGINPIESVKYSNGAEVVMVECSFNKDGSCKG